MKLKLLLLLSLLPFLSLSQVQIGSDIDAKTEGDLFGYDVVLSGDGSTLAVAAPNNDDIGLGNGMVQVFVNNSGSWTQVGQDIYGQEESFAQSDGVSVALSNNGNILAVGFAFNDTATLSDAGQVMIYENIGGTWTQIGQTIEGQLNLNLLGYDVSLSSDGTIVALSGTGLNETGIPSGQVKVYEYNSGSGNWNQIGSNLNGSQDSENYGQSIALSSDGIILAIGAPRFSSGFEEGKVEIYQNISGTWTAIGQPVIGSNPQDNFGGQVSLSTDGSIFAAGASLFSNYVEVYEINSGTWSKVGQTLVGEGSSDFFGSSVSLSSNGNRIAIGAEANDGNGVDSGHTRIYQNESGNWVQLGNDIDGEAAHDLSGQSVSLSSNGSIVAIGADRNDGTGFNAGHVRVFDLGSSTLGVDDRDFETVKLYPNPSTTQFIIGLPKNQQLEEVAIINSLGKIVSKTNKSEISTTNFTPGLYLVQVRLKTGIATRKLIIK